MTRVHEVMTEVQQHSRDATLLMDKEKESAQKEREKQMENIRQDFPFLAMELGKLLTAIKGKRDDGTAMDALCRTIIFVINETEKIIEMFSKVATVLPSTFDIEKMTDVIEGALDPSSSTTDMNVGSPDDTGNVLHGQGDEETQMHMGDDPDDMAKLYSSIEATKKKAISLEPETLDYMDLFVKELKATMTEFSRKYDLDILALVRTIVKEYFGNWENRDSTQELQDRMNAVVGITSRVPVLQDQIQSMITLCGNWAGGEETQPL